MLSRNLIFIFHKLGSKVRFLDIESPKTQNFKFPMVLRHILIVEIRTLEAIFGRINGKFESTKVK